MAGGQGGGARHDEQKHDGGKGWLPQKSLIINAHINLWREVSFRSRKPQISLDFTIKLYIRFETLSSNHGVKEKAWIRVGPGRCGVVVSLRKQVTGPLHHVFFRLPCSALSSY